MNEECNGTGGGHGRTWRAGALAVTTAAAAVLLAACSAGGSPAASSSAAGTTAYQKAAAFAQCMRSHGAPSWPDPNSQGVFVMNPANHTRFNAPASARAACKHLLPRGGTKIPQPQTQQQINATLKFAACMRSHGVPTFPDPNPGGGFSLAGTSINVGSPRFQAAQETCNKIAPW
jgi:hypothetical protein